MVRFQIPTLPGVSVWGANLSSNIYTTLNFACQGLLTWEIQMITLPTSELWWRKEMKKVLEVVSGT